jgi:hypothetical protein
LEAAPHAAAGSPSPTLVNSLVVGNFATDDGDDVAHTVDFRDVAGLFGDVDGRAPTSPTGVTAEQVFFQTALVPVPGLPGTLVRAGVLSSNGGSTQTVALLPGGRAIDVGDDVAAAGVRLEGALEGQRLANMTAGVRRGPVPQSVGVGARQILLIRPNDPYVGQPEVRA